MFASPASMMRLAFGSLLAALLVVPAQPVRADAAPQEPARPGGELRILDDEGEPTEACPLERTEIEASVAGYVNRATVRQVFKNPRDEKIEAVYTFPLPNDAAVDRMVMLVGDRRIEGQIKKREEAREVYEEAKQQGHVASLLEQERANIFTQSVANIEPGAEVTVEISYVQTLPQKEGTFELSVPTVVGPRYIPGGGSAKRPGERGEPTPQVPDGDRITPPVTPEGTRAGHTLDITVHLDAGLPIRDINSPLHEIDVEKQGETRATITLADKESIPNRDFILRYSTSTDDIEDAFLVHEDERGRFFTLILQPPQRVAPEQAMPKEMIFVIDRSGSMRGKPIETAKQAMAMCIERMNPNDTFNLHSFSGGTGRAFDEPVRNTAENREKALQYLEGLHGSGGTEMMPAIEQALGGERDPERVRIVGFMTDGYIGNDMAIIDAVKNSVAEARVFSFGVGNSVNRFLLDNMALEGRGEAQYVTLRSRSEDDDERLAQAATRFYQRVHAPVLTDIDIDWGELQVDAVYPKRTPDLFDAEPIMIHGRLNDDAPATITLRGRTVEGKFEREIRVDPEAATTPNDADALASLWARSKVKFLMHQDLAAAQQGEFPDELKEAVVDVALQYDLMTQFTSFVAVERMRTTVGGEPVTVDVPVEMPEGKSYQGVFGERDRARGVQAARAQLSQRKTGTSGGALFSGGSGNAAAEADEAAASEPADAEPAGGDDDATAKLAEPLRDLAKRVTEQGDAGDWSGDGLTVRDWRIDVMIRLSDVSDETRAALKEAGVNITGESSIANLITGTIDVRKLEALAKLDAVQNVRPLNK